MATTLEYPPATTAHVDETAVSSASAPNPAVEERRRILAAYGPENLRWSNIDWFVLGWMVLMHVGALAAVLLYPLHWQAILVALLLHWFTCSIGICMCYHRSLSHQSLKLRGPAKFLGLYAASICGEGSPLTWSAVHRIHHGQSDQEGDPHSPLDGKWWSHLLWLFVRQPEEIRQAMYDRYVPDLQRDRMVMFFEKTWFFWTLGTAAILYAVGGWPMLLWACCFRMVVAYHSTWFVNSATHLWGYRNYETTDQSRNLWWVAVLAYGEGWHNNHHAHPHTARAGHRWWEFDATWQAIKLLRLLGLATDVDDRNPAKEAKAQPQART